MKVVAIVQARMSSSRLPGKVLIPVHGRPLIVHELDKISRSNLINDLWLATSEDASDDPLAEAIDRAGFQLFRGSLDDVLGRYYALAKREGADVVVRLTGDCPLHDATVIDRVIGDFQDAIPGIEYASNIRPPTFPHGLDTEIFTFGALERAAKTCTEPIEREHVTPGIHGQFRQEKPPILNVTAPADFSHLRWTLDYPADLQLIQAVFDELYPTKPNFGALDVIALMTRKPELISINQRRERNETFNAQLADYLKRAEQPVPK